MHNITILSIGTILRKVPSVRTINLLNHTYSSIQVPMSGRRKYLYRNLIKMMGLSLFHISDDVMKWLGGLETVQLTVNDVTKSRFNGLGKAKNIKLFVPHAYSINAIYLGNDCKAHKILLEAPEAYDVMENSLSFCRELRSFTLVAPKIELMGQTLLTYNLKLRHVALHIKALGPHASLSALLCKAQKGHLMMILKLTCIYW